MAEALALQIGGREVRVSNPDKVFFPERGLTKGDLVALGPLVLPHVEGRPMLMKRYPNGAASAR